MRWRFDLIKRLTFVDYLGVTVIGLFLFFIIFFLRRGNDWVSITIKVTNPDVITAFARPNNEYLMSFVEGDVEVNELGLEMARIDDVRAIYSGLDHPTVLLKIKTKALYSEIKKQYSLKGRPVVYGQGYSFTFSNVKFDGIVVNFPGFRTNEPLVEKTVKVSAQLKEDNRQFSDTYGVLPFIADTINVGDVVRDHDGTVIAKILDKTIKPAKRTVLTSDGSPRVVEDPLLKDVSLVLELKIRQGERVKYYQDFVIIEVGTVLNLPLKDFSIFPTITKFLEE